MIRLPSEDETNEMITTDSSWTYSFFSLTTKLWRWSRNSRCGHVPFFQISGWHKTLILKECIELKNFILRAKIVETRDSVLQWRVDERVWRIYWNRTDLVVNRRKGCRLRKESLTLRDWFPRNEYFNESCDGSSPFHPRRWWWFLSRWIRSFLKFVSPSKRRTVCETW